MRSADDAADLEPRGVACAQHFVERGFTWPVQFDAVETGILDDLKLLRRGRPIPGRGRAVWHFAGGDFTYAELDFSQGEVDLDVPATGVVD